MPRSDSFFIRATLEVDDAGTFIQTPINLGSYVDALGMSVLRVHKIAVAWTASDGTAADMDGNAAGDAAYQITTQSQSSMVLLNDRSVVASGGISARNPDAAANPPATVWEHDVNPEQWTNGYLIAVEEMYLGGYGSAEWVAGSNLTVSCVLECTVEKMSKDAALALALSQQ